MSNLLVEIGNTALKAAWSEKMTLGKTFRYQGEKVIEFILSLTHREKPEVMVVSSVSALSENDILALEKECTHLMVLDSAHKEALVGHGLPAYLSYDRAAAILAARYLFRGKEGEETKASPVPSKGRGNGVALTPSLLERAGERLFSSFLR